ncbi:hypothetical protein RRG08_059943 [Elysia crispata]|uniref:Uncharacterized protein n=1 Tax=Elysia crispata TaxID=231223 RepID=A0AAE0Y737_9GAST|nr:hypothetical protein RRG08_059943 [Elysia crispata]
MDISTERAVVTLTSVEQVCLCDSYRQSCSGVNATILRVNFGQSSPPPRSAVSWENSAKQFSSSIESRRAEAMKPV